MYALIRMDFICDMLACSLVLASGVLTHSDPAGWEECQAIPPGKLSDLLSTLYLFSECISFYEIING